MAKQVSLKAGRRDGLGRQQVKKVRAAGRIPGVVYGAHTKPLAIQLDHTEVEEAFKLARSENLLVDLQLDEGGKTSQRIAFIQEIQHHPLTDQILHLDLHEVRADEKLHARVSVIAIGEPEGVRTSGGILEQVLRALDVECLPKDLPDRIEVDVSALKIGGNIHVNEIKAPAGLTILNRGDISIFTVLAPAKEEVVAAPTETAEPEVIKQKKEGEAAPEKGEAKAEARPAKGEAKPAKAGEAKPADTKGAAKPDAKGEKK